MAYGPVSQKLLLNSLCAIVLCFTIVKCVAVSSVSTAVLIESVGDFFLFCFFGVDFVWVFKITAQSDSIA